MRPHLAVFGAVVSAVFSGCVCAGADIIVSDGDGDVVMAVCADVAATEAARARGLQGRDPLGKDEALLLPLLASGEVCVDNVGVEFAIDVVFVEDDRVSAVARDVEARDDGLHCADIATAIVEVKAGVAADVDVGDVVAVGDADTR